MIDSRKHLAVISGYHEYETMEVRMIKFDDRKKCTYLEGGVRFDAVGNLLAYAINTIPGDSGSPIFNTRGKCIGLHKKGDLNSAVLFSLDGKIPLWFQSQQPSKNYQSPTIQC